MARIDWGRFRRAQINREVRRSEALAFAQDEAEAGPRCKACGHQKLLHTTRNVSGLPMCTFSVWIRKRGEVCCQCAGFQESA
jgi:hypothetical protein